LLGMAESFARCVFFGIEMVAAQAKEAHVAVT
jgi:hypothetical protein